MRSNFLLSLGILFIHLKIIRGACGPFTRDLLRKIRIRSPCMSDSKLAQLGLQLFNSGKYEGALYCFNRAIAKRFDVSSYYGWKANCLVKLNDVDAALSAIRAGAQFSTHVFRTCEAGAETFALDDDGLMKLGEKFLLRKEYDKAEFCFSMAILKNADNLACYEKRAICYREINDNDRATQDYLRVLQLDSSNDTHRSVFISAMLDFEKYDVAIQGFFSAFEEISRWNDNRELEKFADICFSKDKFKEAAQCHTRLIGKSYRNDASRPMYHKKRGLCYMKTREFGKAESDFEEALKTGSRDELDVQIPLIKCLFHLRRYDEALTKMGALNDGDVFEAMAQEFLSVEKYEHALSCFNHTIEIENNPVKAALAHEMRGICYAKLGKLEEAISDFQEALCLDPSVKDGRSRLVIALLDSASPDKTIIEETLALMDGTELSDVGDKLFSKQKYQEAIHYYSESIVRAKETRKSVLARLYRNRGYCYEAVGRFSEAVNDFKQSLDLLSDGDLQIKIHYVMMLDKVEDYEAAEQVLEEINTADNKEYLALADWARINEIREKIEKMDRRNEREVISTGKKK